MVTSVNALTLKNDRINTLIKSFRLSCFLEILLSGMGLISVLIHKGGDSKTKNAWSLFSIYRVNKSKMNKC